MKDASIFCERALRIRPSLLISALWNTFPVFLQACTRMQIRGLIDISNIEDCVLCRLGVFDRVNFCELLEFRARRSRRGGDVGGSQNRNYPRYIIEAIATPGVLFSLGQAAETLP